MSLIEYTLLALSSLFVIVAPLAAVPAFLAMTPGDTVEQRIRMARLACAVATGVMVAFATAGSFIFRFLGITMPAFQLAASVVLLLVALDMLRARRSPVQETPEDRLAGEQKADVAITPLAVPMLSGPGAISTCIVLESQASTVWHRVVLYPCILLVMLASYFILRFAAQGASRLNPLAMRIAIRIMGLLLAAIAMQFAVNALKELRVIP